MNEAIILLGSNINPEENARAALSYLRDQVEVIKVTRAWETKAEGSAGPDFINFTIKIQTNLDMHALKEDVLRLIEKKLGRIRTNDKNAPRTIDLDILIFNGIVVDENVWKIFYVALPLADMLPGITDPLTGETLCSIARSLKKKNKAVKRIDLDFK